MFSFHRPKVYRSSTGCCICKAKSSSSRFTDSKKYEEDFMECFKLTEPRQGEICNACVLLVKRWKKLPPGSDRNWKHVVDARAGPGMKSMSKFKSKNNNNNKKSSVANVLDDMDKISTKKKKHFEREYSPPLSDKSDVNEDVDMADVDFLCEEGASGGSSRTTSPRESDNEDTVAVKSRRHKGQAKRRDLMDLPDVSDFISMDYWKKEQVCCGTIFRGLCGELIVDNRFMKACTARLAKCKIQESLTVDGTTNTNDLMKTNGELLSTGATTKLFSDSSSDSGYDECSNQGTIIGESAFNNTKKEQEGSIMLEETRVNSNDEILKTTN